MNSATVLAFALFIVLAQGSRVFYNDVALDSDDNTWKVMDRVAGDAVITVRVALHQRNEAALEDLLWDVSDPLSPNFHKYLSNEEVQELVAPSKISQGIVLGWAREHECSSVNFKSYIDITCKAATLEKMLGDVEIILVEDISLNEVQPKIIDGFYSLPSHVADVVEFVQNIAMNVHKRRVHSYGPKLRELIPRKSRYQQPSEDQVIPATLSNLYNISYTISTDSSQSVAEFSATGFLDSDLRAYDNGVGLPYPNPFTTVGSFKTNPPNVECTLDVQMITSVGQNGTNFYYTISGWVLDLAQELLTAEDPPLVNSISWSADERSEGYLYNSRTDTAFKQLGVMGVSILAASGDDGAVGTSRCTGNKYYFNPGYPATSPFVTSVGATMLVGDPSTSSTVAPICGEPGHTCATNGSEEPADENLGGYATGGGFSVYEERPSYQDSIVYEYLNDAQIPKPPAAYYNSSNRGFPDVAANGYSILIYRGGRWETVGGTSAATPIWGGVFALMNDVLIQNDKQPIGFANPLLYHLFSTPGLFNNIGDTTTNNDDGCEYGFTSNPNGWDPVTGLGTPNVGKILHYMENNLSMFP